MKQRPRTTTICSEPVGAKLRGKKRYLWVIGANVKEQAPCLGAMENNSSSNEGKVLTNTCLIPLCDQCSHFIPPPPPLKIPENQRFSSIFQGFKMGALPTQRLTCRFGQAFSSDSALNFEDYLEFL